MSHYYCFEAASRALTFVPELVISPPLKRILAVDIRDDNNDDARGR